MTTQAPHRFAVIGHPIAHSRSPAIHAAFAEQFAIKLVYDRIDCSPDDFEQCVARFFSEGGAGLNVTVPFKERAWQLAHEHLSARALSAGAANTLWAKNGMIHGCNTDGVGLVNDLRRLAMPLQDANILLIGAGGAARGVIGELLAADCQSLQVVNRNAARARELVDDWIQTHPHDAGRLVACGLSDDDWQATAASTPFDIVINATASSLAGQTLPLPPSLFGPQVCAYDMMYGSDLTAFLRQASHGGSQRLADGLGMLVGQAAESFRIWHGVTPDTQPVIAQIRAQLNTPVR